MQSVLVHSPSGRAAYPAVPDTSDALGANPPCVESELKRLQDVSLALALLILTLPVLLASMLAIALTGGGPVLFTQRRVGLRGHDFTILKLRTMRNGAASRAPGNGIFNKVTGDLYVTRVGRILRKLSVDELPQLINVLRGEMSIVGPRPLVRSEVERLSGTRAMRRMEAKPGITGLWQVSGRSLLSDEERIRLDIDYVERWTLWLDITILLRTPLAVLLGRGAA